VSIDWMRRLRETGFSQEQAEAIASMPEERYVTTDYLDAKLAQFETSLTWRILGIVGLAIVVVGLLDKFVRP
jgi:hypothetical protein